MKGEVQLGLNNVWFFQSNMDYYQVKFLNILEEGESSWAKLLYIWFYQSNMDYYQVNISKYIRRKGSQTGAQQCLVLSINHGLLSWESF
jgi:hypothetical protein